MWFGVLGPLLVRDGDLVIGVPAARQRVLLAALLVNAGTVVSTDALADLMWDGKPPGGAVTTLRSHVLRLRRVLGPEAGARVATRSPGYVIEVGEEEVDLLRFTCLCRQGGTCVRSADWARASQTLGDALALWRGDPLADVASELLRRDEVPRLEELRLQAVEWRLEARLQQGRHAESLPELHSLTTRHPLREPFHRQLMLALVRCGRQAEALEAYQRARGVLREELGIEPGAELRELHQRVLIADPALAVPAAAPLTAGGHPGTVSPRELPAPVAHFAGRASELAALTALLDRAGSEVTGAIVISAIGGTAGVGKTALAVRWAHQVAGRFPDGQLYVNLRGHDPAEPIRPADALVGFLRSLGVPGQEIPAEEHDRAAQYRSLLAGRRVLVILDNAGSAEQVRPLMPGNPDCAVVVTSRNSLAGLVARDGAARLDLDLLPEGDAVNLLRALIGGRVDAEPEAAQALAARCCRLPLALRVAAEFAAARSGASLTDLVDELADQQQRLALLDAGGDPRTAVRAVFSWSYRHLDASAARAFRLLGLHPGPDFDLYAAAALTGATVAETGRLLHMLADAHLIQAAGRSRYGIHDLLRAYARGLAADQDADDEQRAALTRLFDHYLYTAAIAMDILYPGEPHRRPRISRPATAVPPLPDPSAARGWLDVERGILVAVTIYTAEHGWPSHAIGLAPTLLRYLDNGGHNDEAIIVHSHARTAARQAGRIADEATALNSLAAAHWRMDRYQQATSHLQEALALFLETGDHAGQARALGNLGIIYTEQGHYERATSVLRQVLKLYRETRDRAGETRALGNLGTLEERRGRYDQAARRHQQCLTLAREMGDRRSESYSLMNLGNVDLRRGHCQHAVGQFQSALVLFRETGDRNGEAEALNGLGEALLAVGQPGDARTQHETALSIADQIGDKHQQARAHNGLGHACHATGDPSQAHCRR